MTFIRIRNFEKFQHYRDRKPPWIKLYRDLLEDDKFFELSDSQRYHLIGLFILASQNDNLIPNKPDWLKHQLRTKTAISLETLVATGWVDVVEQDASGLLASCYQVASVETEKRQRRVETEKSQIALSRGPTTAPEEFEVTEELREWANSQGFDNPTIERETSAMLDHFRGNGKRKHDWVATWRNWLRNSTKYGGPMHAKQEPTPRVIDMAAVERERERIFGKVKHERN